MSIPRGYVEMLGGLTSSTRPVVNDMPHVITSILRCLAIVGSLLGASFVVADDVGETEWPQWRGPRGDGTWRAPAVAEKWPETGLKNVWKRPLGGGYAGVVVSRGRAITLDRQVERDPLTKTDAEPQGKIVKEVERVVCVDLTTGNEVWTHPYPETYGKLDYGNGPRAAATIVGDYVYTLGALGKLLCLKYQDGSAVWSHDIVAEFKGRPPMWGYSASPLVYDNTVVVFAGGPDGNCVLAFDALNGSVKWKALSDEAGYSWPVRTQRDGHQQLICWTPSHVRGIDAKTGADYWSVPYEVTYGVSIATPIVVGDLAIVCGYWHGSKAVRLGAQPQAAKLEWEENRHLRGLMSQPLVRGDYGYLLDKQHGLTCFELKTGKKIWNDGNKLTPRDRNPQAALVWLGDSNRILALNANGELVTARVDPSGYHETARADIIGDTWAHPAFSGRLVVARSDSEWVCVQLPID